jgi:hypothetical protein
MRRAVALLGLVAIVAACSRPAALASPSDDRPSTPAVAAAAADSPGPTAWPTIPPEESQPPLPAGATGEIADAIHTRWQFGLRSDLAWAEAVAADPDDWSMLEIPMTPEENDEFSSWSQEYDRLVGILGAYGRARPDEFGGIFVDQRGRQVATLWTSDLDGHEARLRELAGEDASIVLYHVEHPESYLRQLQDRVPLDDDFYASAIAEVTGAGVDLMANKVRVRVSSANPDAPAQLRTKVAEYLGVPEAIVSIESDGTGIALLQSGELEIHVVGTDGHRIPKGSAIDWWFEGDQIGECGPGGDVWIAFDDRGVLQTSCHPGTWLITVTNLGRSRVLGQGTAVIRSNELTKLKITLDRDP